MNEHASFDLFVVGGGPAGYIAAIEAAMRGSRVGLAERDVLGGTCLNRGCIPTKAYLKNAEMLQEIRQAGKRGILLDTSSLKVDMKKTKQMKDRVVKKLTMGIASLLKSRKIEVFQAQARLRDTEFHLELSSGETVRAESVILASGSKPIILDFLDRVNSPRILDSSKLLQLEEVPERLGILGGGYIGVEMARAFAAFGSQVTILEAMERIVPQIDQELSEALTQSLKAERIGVMTGAKVVEVKETTEDDALEMRLENGDKHVVDQLLCAVGRRADLSSLGDVEVELDDQGFIQVDETIQTSVPRLYAPGDVNGKCLLAHAAFKMAEVAVSNALGTPQQYDGRWIPACIYGHPEVATVGWTEEKARHRCSDLKIGRFPFTANGRALGSGFREGFAKVLVDATRDKVVGVHLIGPYVSETINEAAALISSETNASEFAEIVHAHPTCSEVLMEATADALGKCKHLPAS